GFFDPGFGFGIEGEIPGTKAVLEVRAHELPILLEDGQLVGKLIYHKMAQIPQKVYGRAIGSSYQQQGLALSKQFKRGVSAGPMDSPKDAILAPPQLVQSYVQTAYDAMRLTISPIFLRIKHIVGL